MMTPSIQPRLTTESINPKTQDLDLMTTEDLVLALAKDQEQAVAAVLAAQKPIARAVELATERLAAGGRLLYAGAGTSGRLAYLDSSELPPTFGWSPERAVVAMAGGQQAVFRAVEGAEDDVAMGKQDVLRLAPTPTDVLIGIAASGGTPYVLGALEAAKAAGTLRIGIANNANAPVLMACEVPILLETGAEAISGSTRLKAGTAQKIALNTLSSSIMVRLNKVYGNLMVDVQATNQKLVARALRLTCLATNAEEHRAQAALEACGWHVKTAIVMLKKSLGAAEAKALLESVSGSVRAAIV
jgi:N-acetylmuramic acid 6-phosphate etherase